MNTNEHVPRYKWTHKVPRYKWTHEYINEHKFPRYKWTQNNYVNEL